MIESKTILIIFDIDEFKQLNEVRRKVIVKAIKLKQFKFIFSFSDKIRFVSIEGLKLCLNSKIMEKYILKNDIKRIVVCGNRECVLNKIKNLNKTYNKIRLIMYEDACWEKSEVNFENNKKRKKKMLNVLTV